MLFVMSNIIYQIFYKLYIVHIYINKNSEKLGRGKGEKLPFWVGNFSSCAEHDVNVHFIDLIARNADLPLDEPYAS